MQWEESFEKKHLLFIHLSCKDAARFRNRPVHEFYSLRPSQINKVYVLTR